MITFKQDNIFNANVEALVNTVNCVGVMGRGIALQFKKLYPDNFKEYEKACKRNEVIPGKMFVFPTGNLTNPRYIINFPTKRHWRGASRLEDVELGIVALREVIVQNNIKSIAIPPLGCGLGGLDWSVVKAMLFKAFQDFGDVDIYIFEPCDNKFAVVKNAEAPKMTPGRAALIELVKCYINETKESFITLLELHKLLYFLQESGQPLRLEYSKGFYGPYAANLRHVLNCIEGYFITGYADGGDNPEKHLQLVPGVDKVAEEFLKDYVDTSMKIVRVSELIDGFGYSLGLELLSTVHWIIVKEGVTTFRDVVKNTHNWNERKKQFSEVQIKDAILHLQEKGWVSNII